MSIDSTVPSRFGFCAPSGSVPLRASELGCVSPLNLRFDNFDHTKGSDCFQSQVLMAGSLEADARKLPP